MVGTISGSNKELGEVEPGLPGIDRLLHRDHTALLIWGPAIQFCFTFEL